MTMIPGPFVSWIQTPLSWTDSAPSIANPGEPPTIWRSERYAPAAALVDTCTAGPVEFGAWITTAEGQSLPPALVPMMVMGAVMFNDSVYVPAWTRIRVRALPAASIALPIV